MQEVINNHDVTANVDTLRAIVSDDIAAVDELIRARLYSDVALINQLSNYIINSGGKRLRPLLVLLSARACQPGGGDRIHPYRDTVA
jgi:octaprenyl-diphosphate synthase